jgi:hypothetical protein
MELAGELLYGFLIVASQSAEAHRLVKIRWLNDVAGSENMQI